VRPYTQAMPGTKAQAGPVGLDARTLAASLRAMLAALRAHEDELNRLNVFPVRDHDTGTNMALTLAGMVAALDTPTDGAPEPTFAGIAKTVGGAALEAARGNSGVILAEALRGLLDTWAPLRQVGPAELARGFRAAATAAREAVLDPVEGTILSVADAAAAATGATVPALLTVAAGAARQAVAATREQLAALRDAGVVDAAGYGLQLCLEAFAATVAAGEGGHTVPGEPGVAVAEPGTPALFEVEYLLACERDAVDELARELGAIGDSVAVARGNGTFRVHVHTRQAGAAIEAALRRGTPSRIQVSYLGPVAPGRQ